MSTKKWGELYFTIACLDVNIENPTAISENILQVVPPNTSRKVSYKYRKTVLAHLKKTNLAFV